MAVVNVTVTKKYRQKDKYQSIVSNYYSYSSEGGLQLQGSSSTAHIETGHIALVDYSSSFTGTVNIQFKKPYQGRPVGEFKLYKIKEVSPGHYRRRDVLYDLVLDSNGEWLDLNGFSINVDFREDISDVYLDYYFMGI